MSATKIAIPMDETPLQRLDRPVKARSFRSRSQVVQEAVAEKISRIRTLSVARLGGKIGKARPEEVELAVTGPDQITAQ